MEYVPLSDWRSPVRGQVIRTTDGRKFVDLWDEEWLEEWEAFDEETEQLAYALLGL